MNRKPLDCLETGEACVKPACSLHHCMDSAIKDHLRQQARDEHRRQVLQGKDVRDITLDDLTR